MGLPCAFGEARWISKGQKDHPGSFEKTIGFEQDRGTGGIIAPEPGQKQNGKISILFFGHLRVI
jgi:hypothetical protein